MDAKLTPEENIEKFKFWHCFFVRLFKMILDLIHIRSLIFICGSILAARFMSAYLALGDKTPSPYLGIVVVIIWFLLAIGVGWNRTWQDLWADFPQIIAAVLKKKEE